MPFIRQLGPGTTFIYTIIFHAIVSEVNKASLTAAGGPHKALQDFILQ